MDADESRRRLSPHRLYDARSPIAALRDIARIAQPLHEHVQREGHAVGAPARFGGRRREAIAGQRGNHDVERIVGSAAVLHRIRQRINQLRSARIRIPASRERSPAATRSDDESGRG